MKRILIVAGEASGDQHGADLVNALKQETPELQFVGIGGDKMKAAGVQLLYHISEFAVLGISEVVRHIPFFRRVLRELQGEIKRNIDAVILIDYPGFNLRLARIAHEAGKKVIYYICPQLWAWGEKRVRKIKRYVDLALVIFEFEREFFARHGVSAIWVGHPLVDQLNAVHLSRAAFLAQHQLPADGKILALLPGSRPQEVQTLLPEMIQAISPWKSRFTVLVGKSPTVDLSVYRQWLPEEVKLIEHQTHALMKHADVAIVASGTATLELGYFATPMVVVYKVSPLTYWIGKMMVKIENIALVNIVAGKTIVPELIQHQATAHSIQVQLQRLIEDSAYYERVKTELSVIKNRLGPPGASKRAAQKIMELLNE